MSPRSRRSSRMTPLYSVCGLTGRAPFLVGGDHDRRPVLVRPAHHEDAVSAQAVVAGEDVRGDPEAGHVADVARPARIRPGRGDQDVFRFCHRKLAAGHTAVRSSYERRPCRPGRDGAPAPRRRARAARQRQAPTGAHLSTARPGVRARSSARPMTSRPRRPARARRSPPELQHLRVTRRAYGHGGGRRSAWAQTPSLESPGPRGSAGEPPATGRSPGHVAPPENPSVLHAVPQPRARPRAPLSPADDRRRAPPRRTPAQPRPPESAQQPAAPAQRPARAEPKAAPAGSTRGAAAAASADRRNPSGHRPA